MNRSGAQAEALAAAFLSARGLTIGERNYRCRFGEIDLIARDDKTLVFVEVRLRGNTRFGGAAASVTATKQQKLIAAARHYLATLPGTPDCRFDVLALDRLDYTRIEWISNASGE